MVEGQNIVQVKILDEKTDKVLLEVPPEQLVEFAKSMDKYLGVLLDKLA